MNGGITFENRDGQGDADGIDASESGIVVNEPIDIERIELGDQDSLIARFGWETVPTMDGPPHLLLDEPLLEGVVAAAATEPVSAVSPGEARLEVEQLRLAAELAELRRAGATRVGALERELEAAWRRISERDSELADQVAQIASLTLECSGLRSRLQEDDAPAVMAGRLGQHGERGRDDLVARLKARLEERGRALAVAREEIKALAAECTRLRRELAVRARRAAAKSSREAAGRPFLHLLQRLRNPSSSDEYDAAQQHDAALAGEPGTEVATIAIDSPSLSSPQAEVAPAPAARSVRRRPVRRTGTLRHYLIALDPDANEVFELNHPRLYAGRGAEMNLRMTDETVSRLHAVLSLEDGKTIVEDASSTNGLFVNGRRVRRAALQDGQTVTFGEARYQYRVGPSAPHH